MNDTLVLCYHALSEDWPAALSVRPDDFSRHLEHLAARGYRGVTFREALTPSRAGKTVAITFDDAFRSVAEHARPRLDALGWPATVFVPTDFPGSGRPLAWPGTDRWLEGPHAHELAPLGWDRLSALADAGWEIGSHTRSHPRLTTLSDAELEAELVESRRECERMLRRPCLTLAYPYGDVDDRVIAATERAGYRAAAALPVRLVGTGELDWPRVGIFHGDRGWRFAMKVAPAPRRLRRSRAWLALRAGRALAAPSRRG